MRRLLPTPADDVDVDALAELYAYPPSGGLRANMVSSLDGAVTVDGRSGGLSDDADQLVFRVLRALADVVMVGAGTVRREDYGPPPRPRPQLAHLRKDTTPAAAMVVVSRRCALDPGSKLFSDPQSRPVVVTCAAARDEQVAAVREVAEVLVVGHDTVDLPAVGQVLRERGWSRVLTEGGPTLLGALLAADLVDELALTWSPRIVGGDAGRIVNGPLLQPGPRRFALLGLLVADDALLARYVGEA